MVAVAGGRAEHDEGVEEVPRVGHERAAGRADAEVDPAQREELERHLDREERREGQPADLARDDMSRNLTNDESQCATMMQTTTTTHRN
jgi:hypothetical protein